MDFKVLHKLIVSTLLVVILSSEKGDGHQHLFTFAELHFANVAGIAPEIITFKHGFDQTLRCPVCIHGNCYRRLDGRCNHRLDYGATFLPVKRYLRPHYQDKYGQNLPRQFSVTGDLLPSPRLISWKLHPDRSLTSPITLMVMQMGQLLDHDITSAPVPTENNSSIKCCGVPRFRRFKECFPIVIPPDDPYFKDCMEFVRSEYARDPLGFMISPREQINALTSFVDGSAFYGNDELTMRKLRTESGKGALLKTTFVNGKERLPRDSLSDCLSKNKPTSYCQLAGDSRVNEQPGLSYLHLIFHLEHNNIVRKLAKGILGKYGLASVKARHVDAIITTESDEVKEHLFQEARKILAGIFQKIVYCEWLPVVLGPDLISKFKLGCDEPCAYKPNVDPRIANVFLTAAFRFGHTLIPNHLMANNKSKPLKDLFMIPDDAIKYHESIGHGLMSSQSQSFDRFFSSSISKHLFETKNGRGGALDLVALNIQRGRDHGLPPYYLWKKYYGLQKFKRASFFGPTVGKQLRKIYKHMKDVDLFTGGILEEPVVGGVVGETFAHIIGNQFMDLKFGDSFFFQCGRKHRSFTPAQRAAIREASFAKILCKNSDMREIQLDPFRMPGPSNPLVRCRDLLAVNVDSWMAFF